MTAQTRKAGTKNPEPEVIIESPGLSKLEAILLTALVVTVIVAIFALIGPLLAKPLSEILRPFS